MRRRSTAVGSCPLRCLGSWAHGAWRTLALVVDVPCTSIPAPGFWKWMAGFVNASQAFPTGRARNSMLHRGVLRLSLGGQLRLLNGPRDHGRAAQVPDHVDWEPASVHGSLSPATRRAAGLHFPRRRHPGPGYRVSVDPPWTGNVRFDNVKAWSRKLATG